ncbi:MAG: tyrosine-type recombinase/integrase [Xenococcaceae cyanobacterium]
MANPNLNQHAQTGAGRFTFKNSNGRLQLAWWYHWLDGEDLPQKKRCWLSTGLDFNKTNIAIAQTTIVPKILKDIDRGEFDITLKKYKCKNQAALSVVETESLNKYDDLKILWSEFVEAIAPQLSKNTIDTMYAQYTRYLDRLPTKDINKSAEIYEWISTNIPLDSAKRFLTRLSKCCKWAIDTGKIKRNPFDGLAAKIKLPKSKSDEDIHPFNIDERNAIIAAFEENTFKPKKSAFDHSFYAPFVKFCFFTGCRTSEALALQWKHISHDFKTVNFEQALIDTDEGKIIRKGLKTQSNRKFPCNQTVQEFLKSLAKDEYSPEDLVFPGTQGSFISLRSFRKTAWKRVLAGLKLEYRKFYQTRHTFITLALENGMIIKSVAKVVGNSPEVILEHYQGVRDLHIPEF